MNIATSMSFEDCARAAAAAHRRARRQGSSPQPPARRASLFKGAESSRLTMDWNTTLGVADDELRWSVMRLRARARDLARNNPYVRGYLKLIAINVIGPAGMTLQAQVKDNSGRTNKRLNDVIESGWAEWSEDVTIGVQLSLIRFEHQLVKTIASDGEIFVRFWRGFGNRYAFAMEAIDPDLVDETLNRPRGSRGENEIRMGIEVDQFGRPVAYHVWDRPSSVIAPPSERKRLRLSADEVLHIYDPERVNHSRGLSWLAPTMFTLKQLDGMEEAVLVGVRASAAKMGFFVKKDDGAGGFAEVNSIEMEANPGSMEVLPPGYELQSWDPQHPSSEYVPFVKSMLRKIASGLGISYNVLANDLESVNYSSMRSGLAGERDTWRTLQQWWISAFRSRVYREWLAMALLADAVKLDTRDFRKFLDVRWVPRGWAGVDPIKDIEAAVSGMDRGLVAPQDVVAEQGQELEDVYRKISEADKLAKQYGIEVGRAQESPKPASSPPREPDQGGDQEANTARLATDARPANRVAVLVGKRPHRNGSTR